MRISGDFLRSAPRIKYEPSPKEFRAFCRNVAISSFERLPIVEPGKNPTFCVSPPRSVEIVSHKKSPAIGRTLRLGKSSASCFNDCSRWSKEMSMATYSEGLEKAFKKTRALVAAPAPYSTSEALGPMISANSGAT